MSTNGKKPNGMRICDIIHFYNNKRSNSMQVFIDDPYLKDGKWLTSGSVRVVLTKFMEPNNQFNAIKLTFAEATELIFRIQKALEMSILKETELQSQ
ncbi:MAG: hypothetical protein FK733_19150 [Asgard group archaeon]|nr:hypothetical protein [Asgard group archaeon]